MRQQEELFRSKLVPAKAGADQLFEEELTPNQSRPVSCLGRTFENDEARRVYFTEELRKKLQDPEFRKIEGFPIGNDEDILNLSDPPYYTACPNPWLANFLTEWESNRPEPASCDQYHREPFAVDVSAGKNDAIYNAHPYHTKVPPRAIAKYIEHYTIPGDVVLDMFCGTGMTGVGTNLTDDAKLRKVILVDLSPAATWIAYGMNRLLTSDNLESCRELVNRVCSEIGVTYQHNFRGQNRRTLYLIWSDVISCPECGEPFCFWDVAVDKKAGNIRDVYPCPHCSAQICKRVCDVVTTTELDYALGEVVGHGKREPIIAVFQQGSRNDQHFLTTEERQQFADFHSSNNSQLPRTRIDRDLDIWWDRNYKQYGIFSIDRFFTNRALNNLLHAKNTFCNAPDFRNRHMALWILSAVLRDCSLMTGLDVKKLFHGGGGPFAGGVKGTFFVPSLAVEKNVAFAFENRLQSLERSCSSYNRLATDYSAISTQSSTHLSQIPSNSVDYVFVDPPFGSNFIYSELNIIHESWLGVMTNDKTEAVIHRRRKTGGSTLGNYQELMRQSFSGAYRVLKPGRWITVEFSNTSASVWNAMQNVLQDVGFVVANVSALDKQQGSFKAVTTPTAVKQDLIISAYKPQADFEDRFKKEAYSEEGAWDFVRTHLKYLPVVKNQGGRLEPITERDPRILFDQLVAYYVRRGFPVPISSHEFQNGLAQRFSERDGMFFLPEQVAEYDRKKLQFGNPEDQWGATVIEDEQSAIGWLMARLKKSPQPYNELQPDFMPMLSHLKEFERELISLDVLLEQNFLCYDGKGLVPEQIHAHLSTNWKELRKLPKDDPSLVAKARDRWYVPDPNKAGDLEKLREKALLKEFEEYKAAKKKLKVFRLEAVRAGFKALWQQQTPDAYRIIKDVAEKIPGDILEEDPKLLMWYDTAVTRLGGD